MHRFQHGLGLALGATFLWGLAGPVQAVGERPVLVATQRLEAGPYDVTLPVKLGLLEAGRHATLAFDVPGRVEWLALEGSRVEAGAPLARQESRLEAARVHQAELLLAEARRDAQRLRGLRTSRAVSAKALENAETQLSLRQSELAVAREQLRRRTLQAPFAGVVTERLLEPGEMAGGGTPVVTLMNLDPLHLKVGVPGYQVEQLHKGATVWVEVPSLAAGKGGADTAATRIRAVVHRVATAAPAGHHLFRVEIHVPNPEGRLRAGMAARAFIVTRSLAHALVIPQALAVPRDGHRVVFFAEGDRARAVPLDDALLHADHFVLAGTLPYRELVVRGQHDLRDGVKLRVDDRVLQGRPHLVETAP